MRPIVLQRFLVLVASWSMIAEGMTAGDSPGSYVRPWSGRSPALILIRVDRERPDHS